jgi:hypothetical protein
MTYLLDQGLVAPRPDRQLPTIASSDAMFAERVGLPADSRPDRLWQLPPDSLALKLLRRNTGRTVSGRIPRVSTSAAMLCSGPTTTARAHARTQGSIA